MARYRVTAVAIVDTDPLSDHPVPDDWKLCPLERASVRGLAAIKARDVVEWKVERIDGDG